MDSQSDSAMAPSTNKIAGILVQKRIVQEHQTTIKNFHGSRDSWETEQKGLEDYQYPYHCRLDYLFIPSHRCHCRCRRRWKQRKAKDFSEILPAFTFGRNGTEKTDHGDDPEAS
ncbi:hypothetical protein NE237_024005 [Protea cynaroides]|uniref:Uncharacterized protein n=1 Tax=Protea cynaroides TaxID=273540 RepID=A0A9Q0K5Q7_9MAGN|nr:hypothetical protein NE237_024005 [Protea cynaroides]